MIPPKENHVFKYYKYKENGAEQFKIHSDCNPVSVKNDYELTGIVLYVPIEKKPEITFFLKIHRKRIPACLRLFIKNLFSFFVSD